jgi:mannose/fructose-specific phosphotransferase system component IIA
MAPRPAIPCARSSHRINVEAIAGVNLPMLLKALTYRDQGMAKLLEKAVSGGQAGIINIHSEPAVAR